MTITHLEILSTRRTRIGNLRFGVIYKLDDSDPRVAAVIKTLTNKGSKTAPKRPAAQVLSAKEAKKRASDVESLVPDGEQLGATEQALADKTMLEDQNADLQKKFDQQTEDLAEATRKLGEAESRIAVAEGDVVDTKAKLTLVNAECAKLKKEVKALQSSENAAK